jgi:hypothetical protein
MAADDDIRVAYDADDFRALYRACRTCRRNAILLVIVVPMIFAGLSYSDGVRGVDLVYDALPYFLIAVATILGFYFVGPWNAVRVRRKNGWAEPMAVQLTERGVATRHPSQDSLFFWSKIRDVVVRGPRLFLFTSAACAIILPRRAFGSDAQFAEWAKRAEALWRSAREARVG